MDRTFRVLILSIFVFIVSCKASPVKYRQGDLVLLVPAKNIDYSPVWSENMEYIYFYAGGYWRYLSLNQMNYDEAKWHGVNIKVNKNPKSIGVFDFHVSHETSEDFSSPPKEGNSKNIIEISRKGFSSMLTVLDGTEKRIFFKTDLDVLHSLRISPDGNRAIFISESNGLFMMDLNEKN